MTAEVYDSTDQTWGRGRNRQAPWQEGGMDPGHDKGHPPSFHLSLPHSRLLFSASTIHALGQTPHTYMYHPYTESMLWSLLKVTEFSKDQTTAPDHLAGKWQRLNLKP